MACHSHNDYSRSVPLFEALAAGCTGVEADIWINDETGGTDLLVGHSSKPLQHDRTLQALYIQPLLTILDNIRNASNISLTGNTGNSTGIFQSSPTTTLTFFLDFKSKGIDLWPHVIKELDLLRSRNYLTHWSNKNGNDTGTITWAPIIVVASGNAPFDLLSSNTTYRDIFYDAPLVDISNPKYDSSNSYYASTSMAKAIGKVWFWRFSTEQIEKMKTQVGPALDKGLKPRYWDTPSAPVKFRNYIWEVLVDVKVGMLNVDDFGTELFYPLVTRFGKNILGQQRRCRHDTRVTRTVEPNNRRCTQVYDKRIRTASVFVNQF
ncbi:Altered inheritance of mitochondria protein 6 [Clarireedia jacksonii]